MKTHYSPRIGYGSLGSYNSVRLKCQKNWYCGPGFIWRTPSNPQKGSNGVRYESSGVKTNQCAAATYLIKQSAHIVALTSECNNQSIANADPLWRLRLYPSRACSFRSIQGPGRDRSQLVFRDNYIRRLNELRVIAEARIEPLIEFKAKTITSHEISRRHPHQSFVSIKHIRSLM